MKYLITLLVVFTSILPLFGQTLYPFPQAGLMQGEIYHGSWTDPGNHNHSFSYVHDTVIASLTYSYFDGNGDLADFYTKYDSGKIYWVMRNADGSPGYQLLKYDFSLVVNDTFYASGIGNLIVDSVSYITLLNGQSRKYMELSRGTDRYKWIDGIGDIERGFLYKSDIEGGYEEFVCHRDASGSVFIKNPVAFNCDSLTGYVPSSIALVEENSGIVISPNPTYDVIKININSSEPNEYTITLITLLGQTIQQRQSSNEYQIIIDLSLLENGLYLLKISDGKTERIKKVLKL